MLQGLTSSGGGGRGGRGCGAGGGRDGGREKVYWLGAGGWLTVG